MTGPDNEPVLAGRVTGWGTIGGAGFFSPFYILGKGACPGFKHPFPRGKADGQQAMNRSLLIIRGKKANQNHRRYHLTPVRTVFLKRPQITSADEDAEK